MSPFPSSVSAPFRSRTVRESIIETRKVVWPTRKETVQSTAMVVAFVFVMAIFLWGIDWILATVVRLLMGVEA